MPVLEQLAIDLSPIKGLLNLIESELHPSSIWLFGSRAKSTNRKDSDWDLLVVVPNTTDQAIIDDPFVGWRLREKSDIHADILVCNQSDFEDGSKTYNTICYEAFHFGVLIYEQ